MKTIKEIATYTINYNLETNERLLRFRLFASFSFGPVLMTLGTLEYSHQTLDVNTDRPDGEVKRIHQNPSISISSAGEVNGRFN